MIAHQRGFTTVRQDYSLITLSYASISGSAWLTRYRTWRRHWWHTAAYLFNTDQCFSSRGAALLMSYLISTYNARSRSWTSAWCLYAVFNESLFCQRLSLTDWIRARLNTHTHTHYNTELQSQTSTGFMIINKASQKPEHITNRNIRWFMSILSPEDT